MTSFREATAVDQHLRAELDARWAVGDKLHGGYLMAVLGRAVAATAPLPHLVAITTTFLRPPAPGPAQVEVETLRAGRTAGQYRARLVQDGQSCAEALVTQGTLDAEEPFWRRTKAPSLPA